MTKAELINALNKYSDNDVISIQSQYIGGGIVSINNATEAAEKRKEEDINMYQGWYDSAFYENEDASARMIIANEHLSKKETKTWRRELTRATQKFNRSKWHMDRYNALLNEAKNKTIEDYIKSLMLTS